MCFKSCLGGRGGAGALMGGETPGEERGHRRAGTITWCRHVPWSWQHCRVTRSPRGWHGAQAGCPSSLQGAGLAGCWEGALVRSRESRGRPAPSASGRAEFSQLEGVSSEPGARFWRNGSAMRLRSPCPDAWFSAAAFLISHTSESSLLSPNAVPGPTPARTLSPPSLSLSADRRNMVKRKPSRGLTVLTAHCRASLVPGSLSRGVVLCWDRALTAGGRRAGPARPGGCRDSRSDGATRAQ